VLRQNSVRTENSAIPCRDGCLIQVMHFHLDPLLGSSSLIVMPTKSIERAEGDRRNSEEVHRGNRFPVITEKR
jgi:hypothetical protein